MTIHSEHPFQPPPEVRDQARRFRARTGGGVTIWTAGAGAGPRDRAGLTVSSLMTALGEPAHLLSLVDPASDLATMLEPGAAAVVNLLAYGHWSLADVFAGLAPAPGGRFHAPSAGWQHTQWGPVLADARGWAGVRVAAVREVGWSLLIETTVEHMELPDQAGEPLLHVQGRYTRPAPTG